VAEAAVIWRVPLYLHPPPWSLPLYVLGLAVVAWALSADEDAPRAMGLLAGLALVAAGAVAALYGGAATYLLG
jgi:hypothetical protein